MHSPSGSDLNAPFADIPLWKGDNPAGFATDWLGGRTSNDFTGWASREGWAESSYPAVNEEYFEWTDLMAAVRAARDRFVMMELGAGYGRWTVGAFLALRRLHPELPCHFVGVEGEPTHYRWLLEHLRNNGVDPDQHTMIEAVVNGTGEPAWFNVGKAQEWWGQNILDGPVALDDFDVIQVPAVTLDSLLEPFDKVDIIDMDVQGAEYEVLAAAIEPTTAKVKRLHIGTHTQEVEAGLRTLLGRFGWRCLNDYPCRQTVETPIGTVDFNDGVQSWVNPRFD